MDLIIIFDLLNMLPLIKRFLLIIPVFLLSFAASSINRDSLDNAVTSVSDTALLNSVLQQGYDILNDNRGESLQIAEWGIAAAEKVGDKRALAYAHLLLGRVERRNVHYENAIYHYLLALNIYEQLHDHYKIGAVCNSIAIIYMNLKNYQKALKYELYALEQNGNVRPVNYKALTDINNQIGAAYFELGKFDRSYEHFTDAYGASIKGNDEQGIAISLNNLTRIYVHRKQFDKALQSATQSLEYAQKSGEVYTVSYNLSIIAQAYIQKGEFARGLKNLQEAEKISNLLNDHELKRGIANIYVEYYKLSGNYKKALEYVELLSMIDDSANIMEANKRIAELESVYEVEKKNTAYALLKKENDLQEASLQTETTQKQALMVVFIVTFIGAVVVVYYLLQKNRINKRLEALNEEKTNVMSILSHDLRAPFTKVHTLVQLVSQAGNEEKKHEYLYKINEVVKDGTDLIQNLLDTTYMEQHKPVFRIEEIDMLELMQLMLEQYAPPASRKNIRLHLSVEMNELTIRSDLNKLKRVIDNLLSNAIKYSPPDKNIWLEVTDEEGGLMIIVKDEGQGIDEDDQQKLFTKFSVAKSIPTGGESSTGMGLYITRQLCEWLGGSISATSSLNEGTCFYVHLPLFMDESA
jgi:signal transduction histidine kinase